MEWHWGWWIACFLAGFITQSVISYWLKRRKKLPGKLEPKSPKPPQPPRCQHKWKTIDVAGKYRHPFWMKEEPENPFIEETYITWKCELCRKVVKETRRGDWLMPGALEGGPR